MPWTGWPHRRLCGEPRGSGSIEGLCIDLERLAVAGLGPGTDRARLEARLGPPASWWARRRGVWRYPALGLVVYLRAPGRPCFVVYPHGLPDVDPPIHPFPGTWEPGGGTEAPGEDRLRELLGEPRSRHVDEEEPVLELEWECDHIHLSAELDSSGRLVDLCIDYSAWYPFTGGDNGGPASTSRRRRSPAP